MTTHRFNVSEYYRMGELGLLNQRTELIDGIVIDMEPIGPWHADIGDTLADVFNQQAKGRYRVRTQYPIDLGPESQPQPDLVLYRPGNWRHRHPGAADIFLVVEISDTSLSFDLGEKRALYAEAGISEYWIVDVQGKKLIRLVQEGGKLVERPSVGSRISPAAFPDVSIDLTELFS